MASEEGVGGVGPAVGRVDVRRLLGEPIDQVNASAEASRTERLRGFSLVVWSSAVRLRSREQVGVRRTAGGAKR